MNIVKGDVIAAIKASTDKVLVPHVVNDKNGMGAGVAKALFSNWMAVKTEYHRWFDDNVAQSTETGLPQLGECQFVKADNITIVNMVGQSTPGGRVIKIGKSEVELIPVRYQSLEECMYLVLKHALSNKITKILTVKFGCGLAGGSWDVVGQMIKEIWEDNGLSVTVYEP